MSSSLRVNTIVPSTGTNVAIGTANGTVTFTDSVNFVLGTGSSIFSPASNTLTFGTNDAERLRITSAGRIGINQASPGAMLQVDYDEGNSEVGLRLRAYNASGSKTWQLSEVNGNAGVFSIRNQTNSTEGLDIHGDGHVRVPTGDLRVGDNTDSNAGTKTISVGSISSGSGGIGIFANPTNGNSFVQFGDGTSSADQYRGYMNYRHADDSLRFGTATTDRLHIDANGRIGTNGRAPSSYNDPDLLISGDNATLTIMGDGSTNNSSIAALKFRVAGTSTGDYTKAGIFAKRIGGYNDLAMIFAMDTVADTSGVSLADEKMRLTSGGNIGIGEASPDRQVHITNTTDTAQVKVETTASSGRAQVQYVSPNGDWLQGIQGATTSGDFLTYTAGSKNILWFTGGSERMRLFANSKLHLGNSHISSSNLSRLHVGWNTGGTVAGESIIAGTLGDGTTAVSALLTMKNAGNRGAQGHGSGSSLAKFEFNNGTAFEIDKYGRRTLPYQPGCKLTIDTNSQGGGNHAQTGRTILPFNSTGFGYNTGNHYNLTTHTFTAPLDGKYLVILSVNVIGDNIAYIYKNGSIHSAGEFRSNPNGVWEHIEISTVVECSANDTIQPYSQMTGSGRKFNGGNQPGSYWDTFTIYFLG